MHTVPVSHSITKRNWLFGCVEDQYRKALPERVVLELSVGAKIVSVALILTKLRWAVGKVSCFIVHRSSAITCFVILTQTSSLSTRLTVSGTTSCSGGGSITLSEL